LAELEEAVRGFLNRDDIAILLIVQYVADMVRHIIDTYTKLTPAILEIPSKEHAYDPAKDFILKRAQVWSQIDFIINYFHFLNQHC
jgi:V-type H+-transporting ATPase subunit F